MPLTAASIRVTIALVSILTWLQGGSGVKPADQLESLPVHMWDLSRLSGNLSESKDCMLG